MQHERRRRSRRRRCALQIGGAQPHDALERQRSHAGGLDRLDHASAWATVIAIGLPRTMCLPARAAWIVRSWISRTGAAMWTMSTRSRASSAS